MQSVTVEIIGTYSREEGVVRLKIRPNSVLMCSVFFTMALLYRVPAFLKGAAYPSDLVLQGGDFASLANICVGLLVTWTGFVKRKRWAWFVMFIIVWVWAFPLWVLPFFQHTMPMTLTEWLSDAWHHWGPRRDATVDVLLFALMLTALIVPIKSFFWSQEFVTTKPEPGGDDEYQASG
jgi:hypothetical protein